MRLLNLHCHTNYTDGAHSIEELALAYAKNNHIALVITDHDYHLTLEKWEAQVKEASEVSKRLDYPIIVGLEVHLPHLNEEILLLGTESCRSWFKWKEIKAEKASSSYLSWYKIQKDREKYHPFATILAHPFLYAEDHDFFATLDGYEISNYGLYWGDDYVKRMEILMPSAAQYHNIDLHALDDLTYRSNKIDDEDLIIRNDADLISFIKSRIKK